MMRYARRVNSLSRARHHQARCARSTRQRSRSASRTNTRRTDRRFPVSPVGPAQRDADLRGTLPAGRPTSPASRIARSCRPLHRLPDVHRGTVRDARAARRCGSGPQAGPRFRRRVMTRVVVVGSGGASTRLPMYWAEPRPMSIVTPGNPGIPGSVATPATELDADLFVIGPEVPLVDGLADELRAQGKLVFGPGADGAQLEGSKAWMKDLLVAAGVPTGCPWVLHRRDAGDRVSRHDARPVRHQNRRARGRERCARHRRPSEAERRSASICPVMRSVTPVRPLSSKKG